MNSRSEICSVFESAPGAKYPLKQRWASCTAVVQCPKGFPWMAVHF